jgi:3'-5' exoribonuclease
MKSFFVKDAAVNEGNTVTSCFVVVSKQTRQKKNGKPYVHLVLADRTGAIDGKLWEQVGLAGEIQPDDFVKVQGKISCYREQYEIAIERNWRPPTLPPVQTL